MMNYADEYKNSIDNPIIFWQKQAKNIAWYKSPTQILSTNSDDNRHNSSQWFSDGELNTSYLALDHHIEQGRGDQIALIYDSPVTQTKQQFTYNQLLEQVAKFAEVLQNQKVNKGDRVLIYMPMIPQAAIAMLACARIGAIHSVVFGGFAAHELAVRIDDAQPKVIVSASCGIEIEKIIAYKPLVDKAIELAQTKPQSCIIYQRDMVQAELTENRDFCWQTLMKTAKAIKAIPLPATHPLYILYTSGTTGTPKGVVRDHGGHAVAMQYSMKTIYGMTTGDVFWAASDVGWVVGHSYIVYAPLIAGCTSILYEGKPIKTPDAGAFWRVCSEYKVNALFSAPTAFRAIAKEDPQGDFIQQYDLSNLQRLFLAGERLDPATYSWLKDKTQLPVIDHWWQTETGWAIAGIPLGIENKTTKAGSAGVPTPGFKVEILDGLGKPVAANESGNIVLKLPLPPGCLTTIWQNPERYKLGYLSTFDGYYLTGDGGYIDEDGYLFVMGRTDDVINVAGHRLSTGEMEEIVSAHHDVAECAVFGIHDQIKGQVPLALVITKNGANIDKTLLQAELRQSVREKIGAIASLKQVLIVERLPKTRSGKILRKVMRQMIDGEPYQVPSTIDDVSIIPELDKIFKKDILAI
ncbi:MAG: propionyl-CoA synthetase [Alteromonadaceae bacterium]|nr:propionyl-CoA synthetase [Alteromonadaceae bacterium]